MILPKTLPPSSAPPHRSAESTTGLSSSAASSEAEPSTSAWVGRIREEAKGAAQAPASIPGNGLGSRAGGTRANKVLCPTLCIIEKFNKPRKACKADDTVKTFRVDGYVVRKTNEGGPHPHFYEARIHTFSSIPPRRPKCALQGESPPRIAPPAPWQLLIGMAPVMAATPPRCITDSR